MDLEAILARNGELTAEELAFVERELVKATRELHALLQGIRRDVGAEDPRLTAKLGRSADSLLENVERAASLPWPDGTPGALSD